LLFKNIAVLKEDCSFAQDADVRSEGGYIVSVAPGGTSVASGGERVIDGKGKLLMPAFYNAHTHLPMILMRGYGENMKLMDWLEKKIFPFEDKITGPDCYNASMLAIAESFSHGVVSSSDMYFFCEDIIRAAAESGAKLNVSRGLSYFDEILDLTGFRPYREAKDLFFEHHDTQEGRIRVEMSLHAEYTATPGLIEAVAGLVRETGAPVHVHVSETQSEHEECKKRYEGRTPTRVFSDGGVFDNGGIAIHCVWIDEEDTDLLKEKGVTVVSCPVSNMKLANGFARVPLILEKGVNVALGTDGAASNNSFNFFEEMKTLSLAAKARFGDPTLIKPCEALFAATRAGALAQGRPDCGFIKEGFRADMIVLDLTAPSMNPVYEIANNLVYSASSRDILMTVADGRVVYENGEYPTIDVEKAVSETGGSCKRILKDLAEGTS